MTKRHRSWILAIASALVLAAGGPSFGARDRSGPTPPRLGLIDGDVSFWRPGADDWSPAQLNTALAEGDELYVGQHGNAELQIGSRAFVRAGGDTRIALKTLEDDFQQYDISGGDAAFDLKGLPEGMRIEVDTPAAAFTIDRPGYYRVDVGDNDTSFTVRRGGTVHVVAQSGEETDVADGQRVVFADAAGRFDIQAAADLDDWDRWNQDRSAKFAEAPASARYVSPAIAGVDELDHYGEWREEPRYGHVWVPRDVGPDWAPYSTGRWTYDPYYDWTWVDDSPWGWAPYHYGRWVHFGGYWGWAPGPIVVQPAYAPALVAFFGAPGIGVSVGIGAPFVSWCALGFGEPVIPWWGGAGFVGRPYWGGWGGARYVNNTIINNNFYDARRITRFQNMDVRNAIVGIDRNRFGRGDRPFHVGDRVRDPAQLQLVRGNLGVRPDAKSFAPRVERGNRPPQKFDRATVATRMPRDPAQRLRQNGIQAAASAPGSRAQTRVVRGRGPGRGPQGGRNEVATQPGERGPQRDASGALTNRGNDMGPGRRGDRDRANRRFGNAPEPPGARARVQGEGRRGTPEPPAAWERRNGRNRGEVGRTERRQDRNDVGRPEVLGRDRNEARRPGRLERPDRNAGRRFDTMERSQHGPQGRVEPPRGRRQNDDMTRRVPAQRAQPERRAMPRQQAPRYSERQEPRREQSFQRQAPQQRRRMESAAPRDAVPVPMPRGKESRLERRRAPEPRMTTRQRPMQQAMPRHQFQRGEARSPQQARRGGGAPQGGGGHHGGRHGPEGG